MISKSKTVDALDATSLAVGRALMLGNPSDNELQRIANDYFYKNVLTSASLGVTYDNLRVSIDRATKTIHLTVDTHVSTTFSSIANVEQIAYTTASTSTYRITDIELGLVLDTTGSMNDKSKSGKPKIDELKVAAHNMFDLLLPDKGSAGDTRVGIAPFSAAVNAGPFADDVSHGASKDGCVVERKGTNKWTDADPMPNNEQLEPGKSSLIDFDPTEGSGGKPYVCPKQEVLPLTNDKRALINEVDSFVANGPTAGHLGTAWGWYLVSPNWNSIWPGASAARPYHTKNLVKAVVVMTDGIYNTAYNNSPTKASDQAINLCNNAKAQGVIVYTVGFTSPASAEATLKVCASIDPKTGLPNYFHAESQAELTQAFAEIAVQLGQLRVSE
jgi:hypothetical protein